jgi:hypothetical protein
MEFAPPHSKADGGRIQFSDPEDHETPVVAVLPDLSRVPLTPNGHPEWKERRKDEECPWPESSVEVYSDRKVLESSSFKYIPPHLRTQVKPPGCSSDKTTLPKLEPLGGCPEKTTPPQVKPLGGGPGKTTLRQFEPSGGLPGKTTPSVTTAYVRVSPKPDSILEEDMSVNAITYIYEDREVKIWESSECDSEEQAENDEISRNRIIRERLNPAADWFYCHLDGKRIEAGTVLEHGDRVLIRHRDEADPEWWHRAMKESEKATPVQPVAQIESGQPTVKTEEKEDKKEDPELAQPASCLPTSKLDQHEAKAQVSGDKDQSLSITEESDTRGKQVGNDQDCTANLRSELLVLKASIPNTL